MSLNNKPYYRRKGNRIVIEVKIKNGDSGYTTKYLAGLPNTEAGIWALVKSLSPENYAFMASKIKKKVRKQVDEKFS